MKQQSIALLIILVMVIFGTKAYAYDIAVANGDGVTIYYNFINNDTELCVVSGDRVYTCETLVIPETVNYADKTYKVTAIGELYGNKISSITIPNSVSEIGGNALVGTAWYKNQPDGLVYAGKVAYRYKGAMPENTNIVIEKGTLGISDYAFSDYSNLSSVTIPHSVITIGSQVFKGCNNLTSVNIPSSVTSIGKIAFMDCINLASVSIPSTVIQIGENAFSNTAWYDSQPDGMVYAGNVAYNYKGEMPENASIIIENGTVGIADKAFQYCGNLTSISLPNSMTNIGANAFDGCHGLTSVVLPNNISSIGSEAFRECSSLSSINIPDGVTYIGPIFDYCTSLNTVTIPSNVSAITGAFMGCRNLTSVILNEGLTKIGNNTFEGCSSLVSISIPNSVTTIGEQAFSGCTNLTSLTLGSGLDVYYNSVGKNAFSDCSSLSKVVLKNKYVGNYFSGFKSIKEVFFEETVSSIGDEAFSGCTELSSVKISEGVQNIYRSAFEGCISLTSVVLPNSLSIIGNHAFADCCGLVSINIPNSVTQIEEGAFGGCKNLLSVLIPQSVTKIHSSAFVNCNNLATITVDKNNPNYDSRNDCNAIIYSASNKLIAGCMNTVIPQGVTSIDYMAFYGCVGLKSITIPAGITELDGGAFYGCSGLNSIIVEEGNNIYDSRENCNAIIKTSTNELICGSNNTIIPNSVTSIKNNAFSERIGLTAIILPASVTKIEDNAFSDCTGLAHITVDDNNPKYDSRDNCNAIIETATNKLIVACSKTSVPSSVTSYSQYAFKNCRSLSLPNGLQIIDTNMFLGCSQLESITIPNSVVTIKEGVFDDCSNLKTVVFEDGTETITFDVSYPAYYSKPVWFSTCPLDSIYIGRNIKYDFTPQGYGTYSLSPFREKQTLRKVVFGNDVTIIPSAMFDGCINLISVETPEKMDSIGSSVFKGCERLSSFTIPYGIKTIGNYVFYGCKSLSSIVIPESVKTINEYAFYDCVGLSSLVIPNSIKIIEKLSFGMCTSLSEIHFQDSEEPLTIGERNYQSAFSQCPINSIYLGRNIINDSYNYIYSSLGSITTPFDLTISKYVTELSGGTFANCKKIKKLRFEEGADTLLLINDHNAYSAIMPFSGTPIDSIYLARVIVGTDKYYPGNTITPFANVDSTFTLRIGDNLSEIENQTYAGWRMSSLIISNAVSKIGADVFSNCNDLNTVTIEDGTTPLKFMDGSNFSGCQLKELFLGRNITFSEGHSPFSLLESLSKIIIGCQVTSLENAQYAGCQNLKDVVTYAVDVPETGQNVFTESYLADATLHVLDVAYKNYRVKYPWNRFKNFMLIDENGNETPAPSITENEGDASGDGAVNAVDILEIVSYMIGALSDSFNFNNADINGDGVVNAADIVQIVNNIMGK